MLEEDLEAFLHAIRTLTPYLDQLVIVGGWAQQLYSRHEWAAPVGFDPLRTQDLDLALPLLPRQTAQEEPISVLLNGSGYDLFPKDVDEQPPVAEYRRVGDRSGLSLEFLAPLVGAPTHATKTILGISAQTLRHIDLLLDSPWEVEVSGTSGPQGSGHRVRVRIPNAVSFILQKLLIHPQRHERMKQAKDVLYIHDALLTFGHESERLRSLWEHHQRSLSPAHRKRVEDVRRKLTHNTEDIHRRTLEIALGAGRADIRSEEQLRHVLEFGLSQILD